MQKIVVSGIGIVSAIGNNVSETLLSLRANKSGIGRVKYLKTDRTELPVGEVKMSNHEMEARLQMLSNKFINRSSLMGILAAQEAVKMADELSFLQKDRISLVVGTTVGGMDKSEEFYLDFKQNKAHNQYIYQHDCGATTETIADFFDIFSQTDTISTACSSAANAILLAVEQLNSGKADIVVAGGTECLTKFHLNGFNSLMILDKEQCCPFDRNRAGLNLGEGAAFLVVETEEHLKKRMSVSGSIIKPLAQIRGVANSCDSYHQTASSSDGKGACIAMQKAMLEANLDPQNIDYINAHGTGTPNNDLSEGIAIQSVFGKNIPPVSSTKCFTAHSTSAAGSIEAVISILALINNFVPQNLNFKTKIDELEFCPHTTDSLPKPLTHVLSNSFGFGGNCTSLIFSKI